ncbi:AzlC family ABC transporter permease [Fulvimarina sp. 2208YS6-2-32]|uniref:AzlC family ABC transporter permease n=1 Tax=Fulvimarina uroteuthidis TaxID=3098149 RepID=A0ABU5I4Q9_9HYPH|nr:AzlC family ABC transporter permease [Fulvimarina sp. 2208YS6-2-32]MDY8109718.1 AzlC family ABC transporter permease [Fulvimarina sp. 2208YS6-2-32]
MNENEMRTDGPPDRRGLYWFAQGAKGLMTPPAFILFSAFVGIAGLSREAGLTWIEAAFMTATIWALPAQIILVGASVAGTSLLATAFAVLLSSVRLMPMVVALMPELRGPRTRTPTLLFLSHFVAITGWVFAMERLTDVPRAYRTTYFAGFAVPLTVLNTILVAVVFNLMDNLPALATGALAFLTPVYFFCSLYGSARELSGRIALFSGMAVLPIAHALAPGFEILVAGLLGGAGAYFAGRIAEGRRLR